MRAFLLGCCVLIGLSTIAQANTFGISRAEWRVIRKNPALQKLIMTAESICQLTAKIALEVAMKRDTVSVQDTFDRMMSIDPRFELLYVRILQRVYAPMPRQRWTTLPQLMIPVMEDCEQELFGRLRSAGLFRAGK